MEYLMEYAEIAKRLGISEENARDAVRTGLRRIRKAGESERFANVVRLMHIKRADQTYIRCGSIECRPETWIFYQ